MSLFPTDIEGLAARVIEAAASADLTIATAESCTGGLVAGSLTQVPGSSAVVVAGVVSYANEAKTGLLGVDAGLIEANGAVSEPVARAMAQGAVRVTGAGLAVAVTGVAGPGGGAQAKPVGLVHFATHRAGGTTIHREARFGDIGREAVRLESVRLALRMLCDAMDPS